MPTFGRPRMATPISSPRRSTRSAPGIPRSVSTIWSSRSPVPTPCSAESGSGSPRPSRWNSSASASRRGSSSLFADQDDRLARAAQDVRQLLVARADAGTRVDQEQHEVGLGDRGARLIGDLALHVADVARVDAAGVHDREGGSAPLDDQLLAVTRHAGLCVHDRLARRGQAVDERRLADVREADDGDRADERAKPLLLAADALCARRCAPVAYHVAPSGTGGRARRGRPAAIDDCAKRCSRRSSESSRSVASRTDGRPSKRSCSPNANVTGCQGSRTSRCVPCTTAGIDRRALGERDHHRSGLHVAHLLGRLARALDEHPEQAALAQDVARGAHGRDVARASAHGEDAAVAEERLERGAHLEQLRLRHPADRAIEHGAVQDRIPGGHVVRREHDGTDRAARARCRRRGCGRRARKGGPKVCLNAIQVRSGVQKPNSLAMRGDAVSSACAALPRELDDAIDDLVGARARSSRPGSRRPRAASGADRAGRAACSACAAVASPDSSLRRRARSTGSASSHTFSSDSGQTTAPMSRPSTTVSPSSRKRRWASRIAARTSAWPATCETRASTVGVRRRGSSVMRSARPPSPASARASSRSVPVSSAASATARYIAPVSR